MIDSTRLHKFLKTLFAFLGVAICFLMIGIGLGFLQVILAFRQLGMDAVLGYAGMASIVGAMVALLVGLFCYFFLGHERTIMALPEVVFVGCVL